MTSIWDTVCLDCGKEFDYDWKGLGAVPVPTPAPSYSRVVEIRVRKSQ